MTDWAACGSAQKPGSDVLDSKVDSAFSLPAMSKMLHDCGYPAAQFFYTVFLFDHYCFLSILADIYWLVHIYRNLTAR